MAESADAVEWAPVCPFVRLPVDRAVVALVHGGAVAVFRTGDDEVYALSNADPFDRAGGLARGVVGKTSEGSPFVALLRHRHRIDLRSGRCLDNSGVAVAIHPVRVVDGVVLVGPRNGRAAAPASP